MRRAKRQKPARFYMRDKKAVGKNTLNKDRAGWGDGLGLGFPYLDLFNNTFSNITSSEQENE